MPASEIPRIGSLTRESGLPDPKPWLRGGVVSAVSICVLRRQVKLNVVPDQILRESIAKGCETSRPTPHKKACNQARNELNAGDTGFPKPAEQGD